MTSNALKWPLETISTWITDSVDHRKQFIALVPKDLLGSCPLVYLQKEDRKLNPKPGQKHQAVRTIVVTLRGFEPPTFGTKDRGGTA